MAKAHYAVYSMGTTLWISPDAVIVSKGKDVWIRNMAALSNVRSGAETSGKQAKTSSDGPTKSGKNIPVPDGSPFESGKSTKHE